MSRVRNNLFDPRRGLDRGRGRMAEAVWYVLKYCFFLSAVPYPMWLKIFILRIFGASVGNGVYIKPRVNIHMPWKLSLGDDCWIGEEVLILNLETVSIGSNVCISQRAFICTGNHDYRDVSMAYRNRPIVIGDGVWIGAQVFVGPGCMIGDDAVITAGSVLSKSVPAGNICSGNPCVPVKGRWK